MLYYSPQIWCSDDTDAVERLAIQEGTALAYPLSSMGAHVSVCPNQQTGRVVPFGTRGVVAMSGAFGDKISFNGVEGYAIADIAGLDMTANGTVSASENDPVSAFDPDHLPEENGSSADGYNTVKVEDLVDASGIDIGAQSANTDSTALEPMLVDSKEEAEECGLTAEETTGAQQTGLAPVNRTPQIVMISAAALVLAAVVVFAVKKNKE